MCMKTSFLKMTKKLTPETSHVAGMSQIMNNVKHNIREISPPDIVK